MPYPLLLLPWLLTFLSLPALAEDDVVGESVHATHWTEVKPIVRVPPKMPDEAKSMDFDEVRCQLRFFLNEEGEPYDIQPETCPELFHESALEAAWQWRFEPMTVDGELVKAQFVLVIVYRLKEGPMDAEQGWITMSTPLVQYAGDKPAAVRGLGVDVGLRFGRVVMVGTRLGVESWREADNGAWEELPCLRLEPWLGFDITADRPGKSSPSFGIVPRIGGGLGWGWPIQGGEQDRRVRGVWSPGGELYMMWPWAKDAVIRAHLGTWRDSFAPYLAGMDGASWRLELGLGLGAVGKNSK